MGTLTPGVTYIYERVGGIVYAREANAHPSTRREVGWYYDGTSTIDGRPVLDQLEDSKMWGDIHRLAKSNPTLNDALNQVIEIYQLIKCT